MRINNHMTSPIQNHSGVLYVATGQKYVDEAAVSAESVKKEMPDVHVSLVTDSSIGPDVFDRVVEYHLGEDLPSAYSGYLYKILGLAQSPYERTVFLDSDIHCCAPFTELFSLLEEYDLGATLACLAGDNSQLASMSGLPAGHSPMYTPQLNSGVVVYKSNQKVNEFIVDWAGRMLKGAPKDGRYYSDQTMWEGVLATSNVRHATIPTEYNCRIGVPQKLHGTVKLLHGRPKGGWQSHVNMINMNHGYRILFPNMGVVTMDQGFFSLNGIDRESQCDISFKDFTANLFRPGSDPVKPDDAYVIMKREIT